MKKLFYVLLTVILSSGIISADEQNIMTHYTIDNLRLREEDSLSSSVIITLSKHTNLRIIELGKTETIDGITASWTKVLTKTGYEGWCFSGYIKQLAVPEERSLLFASEGFGFKYNEEELSSRTTFIKNHGEPELINEVSIVNIHNGLEDKIITLEYNNLIVEFYEWNNNVEGNFPESSLLSITSKDNIEYLFGIKHGMDEYNLIELLGETMLSKNNNSIWINGYMGNVASILIENNKIKNIVWNYSIE